MDETDFAGVMQRAAKNSANHRPTSAEMLSDLFLAIEPRTLESMLGGWQDTPETREERSAGALARLMELADRGLVKAVLGGWIAVGESADLAKQPRQPDRPTVPEVVPVARAYIDKPENGSGGHLHITLADPNYESGSVAYCLASAEVDGDTDGIALARLLMRMSPTQRAKVAHLCWTP